MKFWNYQQNNSYIHASNEKINNKCHETKEWKSYISNYLLWYCQKGSLITYRGRIERAEQFLEYLPLDDAGSADSGSWWAER